MDLRKEIKLSDLFKRGAKQPKPEKRAVDAPAGEKGGRASFLKRDLSLGGRRKAAAPKEPKQPKPAKEPRAKGRKVKDAPAAPAVPLMRAFNLLPKDDARQRAAAGRRPSTAQLVLAVAALVLVAALGSVFLVMNARVADKEKTYNALRTELAEKNVPIQEPQTDTQSTALAQERQERTSALATALGQRVAWDRLLREFSLVLPDDVWLTSITAKGSAAAATDPNAQPPAQTPAALSTFEIRGYTNEQDGVALLLSRMAVLPELASVQLVSSTRVEIEEREVVEFAITATVKPGTGGPAA